MTGDRTLVKLTSAAAFFLKHALELISEARRTTPESDPFRESFEDHAGRVSGVLKLLESSIDDLSRAERDELADTLRVARDLALLARRDPRWERLGMSGNPAGELDVLRSAVLTPTARAGAHRQALPTVADGPEGSSLPSRSDTPGSLEAA